MVIRTFFYMTFHAKMLIMSRYLNFEGAEPLPEGPYATSIPLEHALDPKNDVLLAFGMNGRVLHPDHGYVRRRLTCCNSSLNRYRSRFALSFR